MKTLENPSSKSDLTPIRSLAIRVNGTPITGYEISLQIDDELHGYYSKNKGEAEGSLMRITGAHSR